jgi:heme oxygenase
MLTLRQRTAPAHEALEDRLDLLSPALDVARYGDVLVAMASVYDALEPAIAAAAPTLDLAGRRKVPALRADLAALGRPFPAAHPIPPIEREADALGALYVTEGATLGGALISAHVREVLPAAPRAFFEAYGADVPLRWSEFRATARALLTTPDDLERAAAAADAVFATFLDATAAL